MFNSFRRSYSFDETLISRQEFANQLLPVRALVTAAVNNNIIGIDSSKNIINNSNNSNLTKLYQDTISSNVPLLTASKSVEEDDDDRNEHQTTQLPIESVLCEHKNERYRNCCGITRHIIASVTVLCLASLLINDMCFNITITLMINNNQSSSNNSNESIDHLSFIDQSMTFAISSIGALVTVPYADMVIRRFGERLIFASIGALLSIATAIAPILASESRLLLIGMRLIQGAAIGCSLPIINAIFDHWSFKSQNRIYFNQIIYSMAEICLLLALPLLNALCNSDYRWPSAYLFSSVFMAEIYALWCIFYANTPTKHSCVDGRELIKLNKTQSNEKVATITCRQLFRSKLFWCVWPTLASHAIARAIIFQYLPIYFVQQFAINPNDILKLILWPLIANMTIRLMLLSIVSRWCWSKNVSIRLFNTISSMGIAMCMLAIVHWSTISNIGCITVDYDQHTIAVVLLTIGGALLGCSIGGYEQSPLWMDENCQQSLTILNQMVHFGSTLLLAGIISVTSIDNQQFNFQIIFEYLPALLMFTNVVFVLLFSNAKPTTTNNYIIEKRI